MPKQQPMTAAEFIAKLQSDPAIRANNIARDREQAARSAQVDAWMAPLFADLRTEGWSGRYWNGVWEGLEPAVSARLLPVLLRHFADSDIWLVRAKIASMIGSGFAVPAWDWLLAAYRAEPPERPVPLAHALGRPKTTDEVKRALANALIFGVTRATRSDLMALALEPQHGNDRVMFASTFAHHEDAEALRVIEILRAEPMFAWVIDKGRKQRERNQRRRDVRRKSLDTPLNT